MLINKNTKALFLSLMLSFFVGTTAHAVPGFEGVSGGGSSSGGGVSDPSGGPTGICCFPGNNFIREYTTYSVSFNIKFNTVNDGTYPYSATNGTIIPIDPESDIATIYMKATYNVSKSGAGVIDSNTFYPVFDIASLDPGASDSRTLYTYSGDSYRGEYWGHYAVEYCNPGLAFQPGYTGYEGWCNDLRLTGDPLHFTMSAVVYRSAEGVYGIKSVIEYDEVSEEDKVSGTESDASGKYSATAYDASTSRGYHDTVTDTFFHAEDGHLVSNNNLTRTFFMHSEDDYSFSASFNSYIYRGLNTKYDSYISNHQRIDSTWNINRTNLGSNSSATITSMAPPAQEPDGLTTLANLSPISTLGTGVKTFTISNNSSAPYHVNLGESKDFCEYTTHPAIMIIGATDWKVKNDEYLRNNVCIRANRPWNYSLSITTSLSDNSGDNILVIDGDGGHYDVNVTNTYDEATHGAEGAKDGSYQTHSPAGTQLNIYTFQLSEDTAHDTISQLDGALAPSGRILSTSNIGVTIESMVRTSAGRNLAGTDNLRTFALASTSHTYSSGIGFGSSSDAENHRSDTFDVNSATVDPGTKFCVVATVNHISSANTSIGQGYGSSTGQNLWLVSNISCRSTSSKSTFQIHGGDVTVGGTVDVASTRINTGVSATAIGSWADYGVISSGDIRYGPFAGLASGAYGTFGRARNDQNDACPIGAMVVANDECRASGINGVGKLGSAGISSGDKILRTLSAKFATTSSISGATHFDISSASDKVSLRYVDSEGRTIGEYDSAVSADPVTGKYYFLSDLKNRDGGSINTEISNGTQVIHVTDDAGLIIDRNLSYSAGNYLNPFDIPQNIIIVDGGNVVITPDVTHLDAWIVVKNGNLVTCIDPITRIPGQTSYDILSKEVRDYTVCQGQLHINGYVAADFIDFTRTYYFTANDVLNSALHPDGLLEDYGERITIPYTSLIWAYNKLNISTISQPSMVYTHTLAPRY